MTEYFIQRTGHYWGNSVVWWRPKRAGYTCYLNDAGRYSEEDAQRIIRHSPEEKMWPCHVIESLAKLTVDAEDMP